MISTSHVSLLSWLQEADYDVWLYLYNNYLIHVINNRKLCKEVHLPNQLQKMIRNSQKAIWKGRVPTGERNIHTGRIYARYLGARSLDLSCYHSISVRHKDKYYLCGESLFPETKTDWNSPMAPVRCGMRFANTTKDDLLQICNGEEYPVDVKKSWNKQKILKAMLSEYNN